MARARTTVRRDPKTSMGVLLSHWQCDGRGGEIRTRDLYVPNVALYQAKLRPDLIFLTPFRRRGVEERGARDAQQEQSAIYPRREGKGRTRGHRDLLVVGFQGVGGDPQARWAFGWDGSADSTRGERTRPWGAVAMRLRHGQTACGAHARLSCGCHPDFSGSTSPSRWAPCGCRSGGLSVPL